MDFHPSNVSRDIWKRDVEQDVPITSEDVLLHATLALLFSYYNEALIEHALIDTIKFQQEIKRETYVFAGELLSAIEAGELYSADEFFLTNSIAREGLGIALPKIYKSLTKVLSSVLESTEKKLPKDLKKLPIANEANPATLYLRIFNKTLTHPAVDIVIRRVVYNRSTTVPFRYTLSLRAVS